MFIVDLERCAVRINGSQYQGMDGWSLYAYPQKVSCICMSFFLIFFRPIDNKNNYILIDYKTDKYPFSKGKLK